MNKIIKLTASINPSTVIDGRGLIATYLPVGQLIHEWNYIVTLKGSQRGHHYHKEFDEYIMFVEGSGVYTEISNGISLATMVSSGDCILIPRMVVHTFYPLADSKVIALLTKQWDHCNEPITKAP